jgi:hypothetical protein
MRSRKAVANKIDLIEGPAQRCWRPVRPTDGISLAAGPPISCSSATARQERPDVGSPT